MYWLTIGFIVIIIIEFIIRYKFTIDRSGMYRMQHKKYFYYLNRDKGRVRHQNKKNIQYYKYYKYHIRGVKINPDARKILVLGDSFTFGLGLPYNETTVYKLQEKMDSLYGQGYYQLLCAATGGWGAGECLAYLEDYIEKIKPEFVLMSLNTDDIGRAIRENLYTLISPSSSILQRVMPENKSLAKKISSLVLNFNFLREKFCIYQWLIVLAVGFRNRNNDFENAPENNRNNISDIKWHENKTPCCSGTITFTREYANQYGEALFLSMRDVCQSHDAKLIVSTTGWQAFWPDDLYDATKIFMENADGFFARNHIPFNDISPFLKKQAIGKNIILQNDHHPNSKGTDLIYQFTWKWLCECISQKSNIKTN